jgi:hypothetical protein
MPYVGQSYMGKSIGIESVLARMAEALINAFCQKCLWIESAIFTDPKASIGLIPRGAANILKVFYLAK